MKTNLGLELEAQNLNPAFATLGNSLNALETQFSQR